MDHMEEVSAIGLKLLKLNVYVVKFVVLSDALFASASTMNGDLGFTVPMVCDQNQANIV